MAGAPMGITTTIAVAGAWAAMAAAFVFTPIVAYRILQSTEVRDRFLHFTIAG